MKYAQSLNCSAEEAWSTLEASLIYEIEETTKKKVNINDIQKGYHYQKPMHATRGGVMNAKVLIREFSKPTKYAAEFTTSEGVNYLSYTLEPLNEYQCMITYEESYEAKKKLNAWNAKVVSIILAFRNKRKVKKIFKNIETFAIASRNKNEETKSES